MRTSWLLFITSKQRGCSPLKVNRFLRSDADISAAVDVQVIVPFTLGHCGLFDYPGDHKTQLLREWVGLAVTDDALMGAAVLLSTCRYILQQVQPGNPVFVQLALQYKHICLQTLRQDMDDSSAPVNSMTIAKIFALVVDEVMQPILLLLLSSLYLSNRRLINFHLGHNG